MFKKVLVISHYYVTGEPQELVNILKDETEIVGYIEHPFYFSKKQKSNISIYEKNKEKVYRDIPRIRGHELLYYASDFLSTIIFTIYYNIKYDVCIAADNLNALSALVLKKLGYINKVVYFSIDYSPQRFDNKIINILYHTLDKICCVHSDYLWNTSNSMITAREKTGIRREECAPQIEVPNATNFNEITRLTKDEINRYNIVFLGHLIPSKGIELLIDAFSNIIEVVPQAKCIIIGDGPLKEKLEIRTKELHIEKQIEFKGYIEDDEEVNLILTKSAIGVAPYLEDRNNLTYYSDPLKPKLYMACGLPVIITEVPRISQEIRDNNAGIVIHYDKDQLVDAVLILLMEDELYYTYRKNAIKLASKYTWKKVFIEAINETAF